MFHSFFRSKILAPGESVEDFREVTEAERQSMLDALAAWKRPPQVFIDLWNEACIGGDQFQSGDVVKTLRSYGRYNEETGYFELNGLTDITYEEAMRIMDFGHLNINSPFAFAGARIRTNLPPRTGGLHTAGSYYHGNIKGLFDISQVEVINICVLTMQFAPYYNNNCVFGRLRNLRRVIGEIVLCPGSFDYEKSARLFQNSCPVEDLRIWMPRDGMQIQNLRNINAESIKYSITVHAGTEARIKVHRDVFAKLTGDTSTPAVADLSPEELAEWTELPALAAEKNITFLSA